MDSDKKEKISIIIPCYNVEKYIERCLKSIINQTYGVENLEIICIDDVSNDSTYKILTGFKEKYPENIIVIKNAASRCCGGSRNAGLDISTGSYIMFVDGDDYIAPDMLEKMYAKAKETGCDMVECCNKRTDKDDETGERIGDDIYLDLTDDAVRKNYILNFFSVTVWARLYRADYIQDNNLRFIENEYNEDVSFTGLGLFLLKSIYYLKEELYFYYVNNESIMSRKYDSSIKMPLLNNIDYLQSELSKRGLMQEIKQKFWGEYEYYAAVFGYLRPMGHVEEYFEKRVGVYKERIKSRYGDVADNVYLNSLQLEENKRLVSMLKK